ncbi:hypothetical protein SAMN02745126_06029 [Enhydrobacter aerosaccus]|uniref:Uncharacterized protein n=1 Tax=Enhydrobacter aerosaccus TaxID=225324 RepID=A0A1T4TCJ5_9HYPH|nr:hypothetical protein [Enhydrobacter aerosaccus]SKA38245.1 hypothetical protein SAMN02745126_06029 [Enhydrobacter aerosaccus]
MLNIFCTRLQVGALLGLLALSFPGAGWSQTKSGLAGLPMSQTVRVFDAVVIYPVPPWVARSSDPLNANTSFPLQRGNTYSLEQISPKETLQNWTQMLKITGMQSPEVPKLGMRQALGLFTSPYSAACDKGNAGQQLISEDKTTAVVVILCGNTAAGNRTVGYGDGVGEISVAKLFALKNTLVAIQFSWRGRKFSHLDAKSFFVPVATINDTVAWLNGSTTVSPAP